MNILHIIPDLSKGGAERLCLDIVNELKTRVEHDYLLVVLGDSNDFKFLCSNINIIQTTSSISLSLLGNNTFYLNNLQTIVDQFNPDIIHSHLFLAEFYSKHIVSNAKRFCHVHDNMNQLEKFSFLNIRNKQNLVKYFEKRYYRQVSKGKQTNFICISKDAENFVINNLNDVDMKTHFFPNAINTELFAYKKKHPNPQILKLCNIGSFAPKKAQALIIDVLKRIEETSNLKVELEFLGDGEERENVEKRIKELDIRSKVTFHGNVNHPEDFLHEIDIYVHSAYYEPFGLVLIEAMATGTPVICTDGKGNRDFIHSGNAIMIDDRTPDYFAKQILKLKEDKKLYKKLIKGGLETSQRYDISQYVDNLIELYKRV